MKKAASRLPRLLRLTLALTYPLILQMGVGAPERRGRPCAEYVDPLVEHAGGAVYGGVVERAGVFSRSRRAELFGKSARA